MGGADDIDAAVGQKLGGAIKIVQDVLIGFELGKGGHQHVCQIVSPVAGEMAHITLDDFGRQLFLRHQPPGVRHHRRFQVEAVGDQISSGHFAGVVGGAAGQLQGRFHPAAVVPLGRLA